MISQLLQKCCIAERRERGEGRQEVGGMRREGGRRGGGTRGGGTRGGGRKRESKRKEEEDDQ